MLHADQRQKPAQHHDGRATLDTRGRLQLTMLLTRLGLVPSDHSALALCNPAWLTVSAPLSGTSYAESTALTLQLSNEFA